MANSRLMAVDPSLTCSGWALFELSSSSLLGVGKIRALGPSYPMATRLVDLQQKISSALDTIGMGDCDIMVCEEQTTMRDPHAAFKVEQVRGIFETLARARRVVVPGRINPRSVHFEVMGLKGRQLPREQVKELAVQMVHSLYRVPLHELGFESRLEALGKHQDVVDAILVGSLGVAWTKAALNAAVTPEDFFDERRKRKLRRISVGVR